MLKGSPFGPPIDPKALKPTIPAKWMYERVVKSINEFEQDLDFDHEVGARLVSFGSEVTFNIVDVGYWGPDMIIFHGISPEGKNLQLLQHMSQLSVLLVAAEKVDNDKKARRIGFKLTKELDSEKK